MFPKQKIEKRTNYYHDVWLRSCKKEVIEPTTGNISGTIPPWLNGVLIRNGPGLFEIGDHSYKHLFDGSALLHRFAIKGGKITYQCRFLQTETYKKNSQANRIVVDEFGTNAVPDPCHTIFKRLASNFSIKEEQSDNTNISVYPFGDELYAFGELPVIHRVNQESLEAEGKVDISETIAIVSHTAHPHVLQDGTVYNLAMSVAKTRPCHHIVCFPAKPEGYAEDFSMFEQAHVVATIPARWPFHPSYMHTFGITENYFIIVEQPLSLSVPNIMTRRLTNKPFVSCFQWYGNEMTQFNVINRKTGELAYKFYSESFCYFHIINQYENCKHIIVDICSYKDASPLDCVYIETLKNMQTNLDYANMLRSQPIRFVLPLTTTADEAEQGQNLVKIPNTSAEAHYLPDGNILVKPETLSNLSCEMPRIHYEKYLGKDYQFYYALSSDVDAENPGMIIKVDTHNKTSLTWYEENCYPSEPVFVAKPNPQTEDDGVVLASMLWGCGDINRTGLIILDAKTFKEIARAEFKTPAPVSKCFHGWFLPEGSA